MYVPYDVYEMLTIVGRAHTYLPTPHIDIYSLIFIHTSCVAHIHWIGHTKQVGILLTFSTHAQ